MVNKVQLMTPDPEAAQATGKRVLVIDDDTFMLSVMKQILCECPGLEVHIEDKPQGALKLLAQNSYNLVISDIRMPSLSGIDLLERIRNYDDKIQVILMTGDLEPEIMRQAIKLGAFDFLRKPFEASELEVATLQALEKNKLLIENDMYHNKLEQLIEQRTGELLHAKSKLETHYLNAINAMVTAIEISDIYTVGHSERVTAISLIMGKFMSLSTDELRYLRIGAMLHDLGKIGRVHSLVSKVGKLSDEEFIQIKQHPVYGAKIISSLGLPPAVEEIILQHHERPDGMGYPSCLKIDQISLYAKIVSIADSYDAMTSRRAYRENLLPRQAADEILAHAGSQFDADLARLFHKEFDSILRVVSSKSSRHEELLSHL